MSENQTVITYKRVKNLGNYQSETLEISTSVPDDVDLDFAIDMLKKQVLKHLGIENIQETDF